MVDIKLISKDTDIGSLKMGKYNWDVVINQREYQVVKIDGYVHSIGGKYGDNDLWAYPRDEEPTYENLIEFSCEKPVCWGIKYEPKNYARSKWGECEARTGRSLIITRNGEDFCDDILGGIHKALSIIEELDEHPMSFYEIDFDKKVIGRKVWWRSQPAVITRYINGQACVIIEPDGIDKFKVPEEFAEEEPDYYDEGYVKASVFDKHIWWFRD